MASGVKIYTLVRREGLLVPCLCLYYGRIQEPHQIRVQANQVIDICIPVPSDGNTSEKCDLSHHRLCAYHRLVCTL